MRIKPHRALRTTILALTCAAASLCVTGPAMAVSQPNSAPATQFHVVYRQSVEVTTDSAGTTHYKIAQLAAIPDSTKTSSVTPNALSTACASDGSDSVSICEQLSYNRYTSSGRTYGQTIQWYNQATGSAQARLRDLQWHGAQHGNCISSCGAFGAYWDYTFNGDYQWPTSGYVYTTTPAYGSPYLNIAPDMAANNFQCINQTLTWLRGTGTYYVSNPNLCIPY